jgi:hypothetical protein
MTTSIRQILKRSSIAVSIYLACKRVAARLFFPSYLENGQPNFSAPAPEFRAPVTAVNEPPVLNEPQATQAPAEPQMSDADFDIYHQYPPHVLYTFREKDELVRNAMTAYSNVSVADEASGLRTDPNRVLNFFQLIEAANRLPAGDYIELGSHRGFSLRVIHRFMDPSRTLYSLDTFEGFDQRDIETEKSKYDTQWTEGSFAPTSVERVAHYVGDGSWPDNLKMIKGWFPESFKGLDDVRWRFVHIDFDLYQPIKSALETLWKPLLPGGIIMIHDYGCYGFPAARTAVDEFCESIGQLPIELTDRWSTAVIRKPLDARTE